MGPGSPWFGGAHIVLNGCVPWTSAVWCLLRLAPQWWIIWLVTNKFRSWCRKHLFALNSVLEKKHYSVIVFECVSLQVVHFYQMNGYILYRFGFNRDGLLTSNIELCVFISCCHTFVYVAIFCQLIQNIIQAKNSEPQDYKTTMLSNWMESH